jgi:hypothetical protein
VRETAAVRTLVAVRWSFRTGRARINEPPRRLLRTQPIPPPRPASKFPPRRPQKVSSSDVAAAKAAGQVWVNTDIGKVPQGGALVRQNQTRQVHVRSRRHEGKAIAPPQRTKNTSFSRSLRK